MGSVNPAAAQDATVLSAGAVEPGLAAALALYRKESGMKVAVTFNTAPQIRERIEKKGRSSTSSSCHRLSWTPSPRRAALQPSA